jgi:hypothetical protein
VLVIHTSYLEQQYMVEMVDARRNGDNSEQRYDLFSGLLDAAQDELGSEGALSDEELFGGYSTLRSFAVLRKLSYPSSQETCLSFTLLDMRCDLLFPAVLC